MNLVEIILIGIGLSMDTAAVSITLGLGINNINIRNNIKDKNIRNENINIRNNIKDKNIRNENIQKIEYFIPALYFGFFQFLMPIIGYFLGIYFVDKIQNLDHWIAFALLAFIGGKMIKESVLADKENEENEETKNEYSFKFKRMLILALATSIDALAVGISFAFLRVSIFKAGIVIGIITFFMSLLGVIIGKYIGAKFKSKAEFLGGLILIFIGIKILFEHLFF